YGSRMAFCTQQSIPDMGAFIAYPMVHYSLFWLGDMRSKVVPWNPPVGPFSALGTLPGEKITVFPNPFRSEIRISIPCYRGACLDAALYDITGKLIGEIRATDLDEANRKLGALARRLV